ELFMLVIGPFAEKSGLFRSLPCNISLRYRFTVEATRHGMELSGNERGLAYRLDEGPHRLCPIWRAGSNQPADGFVDAGLSDPRSAHRPRPGTSAGRFQAGRDPRLEYFGGARLSPPRTRPGRPPQRVRRPDQQRGGIS